MSADIGITTDSKKKVAELINLFIANEFALYLKTMKYHWNVVSPSFTEHTNMFLQQANEIGTIIENAALRIRQLDGDVICSITEFSKMNLMKEDTGSAPGYSKMIKNLLDDHEAICTRFREAIYQFEDIYRDYATALFMKATLAEHEKLAMNLRAYVQ
jgi:starvation-inducible DNA-binding protein